MPQWAATRARPGSSGSADTTSTRTSDRERQVIAKKKEDSMLLRNKVAVIYGAGGAVGGAVARAFAREGATLFLTGRHLRLVEALAKDIVAADGSAEAAEVDALDEQAVDKHLQSVIAKAGRIDISFDAVGIQSTKFLGVPLVELDV